MSFDQLQPADAKYAVNQTDGKAGQLHDGRSAVNSIEHNINSAAAGGTAWDAYELLRQGAKNGATASYDAGIKAAQSFEDGSTDSQGKLELSKLGFPTPEMSGFALAAAAGADKAIMAAGSDKSAAANKDSRDSGAGTNFWGESPDPSSMRTGERAVGRNVMQHLGDWDWLIGHQSELHQGIASAYTHMTPEAFKQFIGELGRRSDGNIYISEGNGILGSLNPLNPPGDQVVRVYLRRGGIIPNNCLFDSRNSTSSPVYQSR